MYNPLGSGRGLWQMQAGNARVFFFFNLSFIVTMDLYLEKHRASLKCSNKSADSPFRGPFSVDGTAGGMGGRATAGLRCPTSFHWLRKQTGVPPKKWLSLRKPFIRLTTALGSFFWRSFDTCQRTRGIGPVSQVSRS